jgi:hypothetical protein
MGMHPGYYFEQALGMTAGIVSIFFGFVFLQMRHKSFKLEATVKVKLFPTFCHLVLFSAGALMVIWNIDPRGLYGIYSIGVLVALKDLIQMLFLSTAFLFAHAQYVHFFTKVSQRSPIYTSAWIGCGIPTGIVLIADIVCDSFAISRDQEYYRVPQFYITSAVVFIVAVCCTWMFYLVSVSERAVSQSKRGLSNPHTPNDSVRNFLRKLVAVNVIMYAMAIVLFTGAALNDHSVSLTQAQIPDAQTWKIYNAPYLNAASLAVIAFGAYIPLKNTLLKHNKLTTASKQDTVVARTLEAESENKAQQ